MSYKPTRHGKPGVGATKGSQHTDKKWSKKYFLFFLYENNVIFVFDKNQFIFLFIIIYKIKYLLKNGFLQMKI